MRFHFLIGLFLLTGTLMAQNRPPQKPKVVSVTVEGNIKSDADLIKIAAGLNTGQEIGLEDIQKVIENLWAMNVFKDIQVYGTDAEGGLAITIVVKEYPRLESLELKGTDEIDEKDVRSAMNLFVNQTVSPQRLKSVEQRVKRLYATKGFLNAKVDVKSYESTTDTGKVLVKVNIEEGGKVRIRGIRFHGNENFSDGKLRGAFDDTKAKTGFFKWFKSGDFDEKKYREDLRKLVAFYKKEGYRDIEVLKDSIYYGKKGDDLYIDVWVDEGVKYYLGDITWSGNTLFSNAEMDRAFGLERGDVFNQEKFDRAMQERVHAMYYDQGYIYAQIVPIEKPVAKDTLDLEFIITENGPVTISKVEIRDNTKTKEKVIRREVVAFPGEIFSRDALIRTQRNLMVLNYFENVIPDIQPIGPDKVNVIITVKEKPTDTANLSMGYSGQDGLIGSAGVAFNNFLGNGQTVSTNIQLGGQGYRVFQVGFSEPYLFDTRTSFGASMFYTLDGNRRAQIIGVKNRSWGGSLSFGRRLRWPDDFFTANWSISYSNARLRPFDPNNLTTSLTFGDQNTVTLAQVIQRDSRDAAEFPRTGSTYTLTTELGFVNIDTAGFPNAVRVLPKDYNKHTFRAQHFVPVFGSFVLYTDFNMGYVRNFRRNSIVEEIPFFDRFFMGGGVLDIGSIQLRGYGARNVGPQEGITAIGGSTMFKYSSELRLQLIPNPTMYILAFAEGGNVFRSISNTDPFQVKRSVGYGFRLFMPLVGMIGLDVGYGLDKQNKKSNYPRLHFQFGQQF